jgi:hypothetical protein
MGKGSQDGKLKQTKIAKKSSPLRRRFCSLAFSIFHILEQGKKTNRMQEVSKILYFEVQNLFLKSFFPSVTEKLFFLTFLSNSRLDVCQVTELGYISNLATSAL